MVQILGMKRYTAVIQAGGNGTRMYPVTHDKIPKPLIDLNGRPMIEWQIKNLKENGITDFVVIIGHLGKQIEDQLGDGGGLGVRIRYIRESKPLGSAGSLYKVKEFVGSDDIILVFGDVMFDLDWQRFISFHEKCNGDLTLLAHPNSHPEDSDILIIDNELRVMRLKSKSTERSKFYHNRVNAGLYIIRNNALDDLTRDRHDLEKDVVIPLINNGLVFAYSTSEYVKDAGTPERFEAVCIEQKEHIWKKRCLKNKQRCIFLDRDGTINKFVGFLTKIDQMELEKRSADAIRMINESGYLAIVVTNQPVVARGECTLDEEIEINNKMETMLGERGAYLDDIAFCPHHPDKGFEGENPEYKIDCDCRKPKTGMLMNMAEKYNIDLRYSWIIGDSTRDIQTGINAGLHTVLVKTGEGGKDGKYDAQPEIVSEDLYEAVQQILKNE